ncbi:Protein-lysine N-methyltransferase efm4 [Pseudogymnoascus australis]
MADQTPATPAPLEASELGTKEYWDALYTRESTNHAADPTDEGTIWFDDSSAEDKLVTLLRSSALTGFDPTTASFLDLGTGNGHLLFRLRDEGVRAEDDSEEEEEEAEGEEGKLFRGRMLGTDYSATSISFARAVAAERGLGDGEVEFVEWDVLASPSSPVLSGPNADGWDVVLDKGTFDAVSLMGDAEAGKRYVERVREVVRKGGWAVVTSCNWTEGEVRGWFEV